MISGNNSINLPKNLPLQISTTGCVLSITLLTPSSEHGEAFSADSSPEMCTQFSSQYQLLSYLKCVHAMLAGELCNDTSESPEASRCIGDKKKTGLNDNRHKIIFLPFRVKITGFGHWRNSDGGGQRGESSPGKLHVKTGPALSL